MREEQNKTQKGGGSLLPVTTHDNDLILNNTTMNPLTNSDNKNTNNNNNAVTNKNKSNKNTSDKMTEQDINVSFILFCDISIFHSCIL